MGMIFDWDYAPTMKNNDSKIDRGRIIKALLAGFIGFIASGMLIHQISPDIRANYPGINLLNALVGVGIVRWVWKSGNQKSS